MIYWIRMWWEGLKYFFSNVKANGVRRAFRIFRSNFKSRTHMYRTGVPVGMWAEPSDRLPKVMKDQFFTFVEEQDGSTRGAKTEEGVLSALKRNANSSHSSEYYQIAYRVYKWFKRDRKRLLDVISEYKEMEIDRRIPLGQENTKLEEMQGYKRTDKGKAYKIKASRLERRVREKDQEAYERIANLIPWMWT